MAARPTAAVLAALAWAALLLQLVLSLRLSFAAGRGVGHGLAVYASYFTVLSNLFVAAVATAAAARADGGRDLRWRGCAVTAIVVVGVGYHVLLREVWDPQGLQWLADVLLHYAVPVFALLWWLALPPRKRIPPAAPLLWLAWPAAYLAYALLRGAVTGSYPYYFLDTGRLGMARVLANAAGLGLAFLLAGLLLRALAHLRRRGVVLT